MGEWVRADCNTHACIEVQDAPGAVLIRAAADPERPIAATRAEFTAFVRACKKGRFDHLTDPPRDGDDRLAAVIEQIRVLHRPTSLNRQDNSPYDGTFCAECEDNWPCPTTALLPPATQPTGERIAQAELDRGEGVDFDNVEDAIAWLKAPEQQTQEGQEGDVAEGVWARQQGDEVWHYWRHDPSSLNPRVVTWCRDVPGPVSSLAEYSEQGRPRCTGCVRTAPTQEEEPQ